MRYFSIIVAGGPAISLLLAVIQTTLFFGLASPVIRALEVGDYFDLALTYVPFTIGLAFLSICVGFLSKEAIRRPLTDAYKRSPSKFEARAVSFRLMVYLFAGVPLILILLTSPRSMSLAILPAVSIVWMSSILRFLSRRIDRSIERKYRLRNNLRKARFGVGLAAGTLMLSVTFNGVASRNIIDFEHVTGCEELSCRDGELFVERFRAGYVTYYDGYLVLRREDGALLVEQRYNVDEALPLLCLVVDSCLLSRHDEQVFTNIRGS